VPLEGRHPRRFVFEDGDHQVGRGLRLERLHAADHFVENRAERKDVGARVGLFAANLFGRHVLQRANNSAVLRQMR
jgi:hypothetical protein